MDSDTVEAFLQEETYKVQGVRVERGQLFQRYQDYCFASDRTALTRNNFFKSVRCKGFTEIKTMGVRYFEGISFEKPALKTALPDGYVVVDETLSFMDG